MSFARYILTSRLCDLLDEHPGIPALPCDGGLIRKTAEKLQRDINRRWETRDSKPHVDTSDLAQIRAELVELRLKVTGSAEPSLKLIGGASNG
jgi:hypothetical protein